MADASDANFSMLLKEFKELRMEVSELRKALTPTKTVKSLATQMRANLFTYRGKEGEKKKTANKQGIVRPVEVILNANLPGLAEKFYAYCAKNSSKDWLMANEQLLQRSITSSDVQVDTRIENTSTLLKGNIKFLEFWESELINDAGVKMSDEGKGIPLNETKFYRNMMSM